MDIAFMKEPYHSQVGRKCLPVKPFGVIYSLLLRLILQSLLPKQVIAAFDQPPYFLAPFQPSTSLQSLHLYIFTSQHLATIPSAKSFRYLQTTLLGSVEAVISLSVLFGSIQALLPP
jgi:hypothetical protein